MIYNMTQKPKFNFFDKIKPVQKPVWSNEWGKIIIRIEFPIIENPKNTLLAKNKIKNFFLKKGVD